jgi:hypothetical protein
MALAAHAAVLSGWAVMTPPTLRHMSLVALQANSTRRAVTAEVHYGSGDYAMPRTRATTIGPWEQYIATPEQRLPVGLSRRAAATAPTCTPLGWCSWWVQPCRRPRESAQAQRACAGPTSEQQLQLTQYRKGGQADAAALGPAAPR